MDNETRALLEAIQQDIRRGLSEVSELRNDLRAFEEKVERRFERVDHAFEKVDHRFDVLATSTASEFGRLHQRLDQLTHSTARAFGGVEARFADIEA